VSSGQGINNVNGVAKVKANLMDITSFRRADVGCQEFSTSTMGCVCVSDAIELKWKATLLNITTGLEVGYTIRTWIITNFAKVSRVRKPILIGKSLKQRKKY
jgi:hypothetical protein